MDLELERTRKSDFNIYTGALSASSFGDRKVVDCTASSSVVDLHGDEITSECVQDMARQALAKGMTIFLNHSYDVPEDTFGSTIAAEAVQSDDPTVWDMKLGIEVDESNPRALQTWSSLQGDPAKGRKGLRLGVSIGAQITDWEYRDTKKGFDGGLRIKGVDLLEASIVGIPANPRSWVQNAVKSIRAKATLPKVDEQIEQPGTEEIEPGDVIAEINVPNEGIEVEVGEEAVLVVDDPNLPEAPQIEAELTDEEVERRLSGTPDDSLPSAPEDGDSRSEVDVETADPDIESVVKSVAELTVSEADQPVLEMVLSTLELTASELKATRSQLASLTNDLEAMRAERDKAISDTQDAAQIIEVISKLPLGRKTRFVEPIASFRQRFSGIYDEDLLRLIDERNSNG